MSTTTDTIEHHQDALETDPNATAPQELEEPIKTSEPERLVPVGEAIRYRKRAQAAEQQLNELRERLTEL
ncbi:MAG: hypothetical protein AAGA25_00330 [Planctomycetota bacterium]